MGDSKQSVFKHSKFPFHKGQSVFSSLDTLGFGLAKNDKR